MNFDTNLGSLLLMILDGSPNLGCNGHYNRMPDLGKCGVWGNTWDLARHTILDTKVLDRNITWLTKHKDTSDTSTRCEDTWLPL